MLRRAQGALFVFSLLMWLAVIAGLAVESPWGSALEFFCLPTGEPLMPPRLALLPYFFCKCRLPACRHFRFCVNQRIDTLLLLLLLLLLLVLLYPSFSGKVLLLLLCHIFQGLKKMHRPLEDLGAA